MILSMLDGHAHSSGPGSDTVKQELRFVKGYGRSLKVGISHNSAGTSGDTRKHLPDVLNTWISNGMLIDLLRSLTSSHLSWPRDSAKACSARFLFFSCW